MQSALTIHADWEALSRGPAQERACFAALGIYQGSRCLTEAHDAFVNRVREKPHLSAYRLAEWLAWNWWRLRWEPRSQSLGWQLSHRMSTIGGGYVWPNITIYSDGERVALLAKPTSPLPQEPLRYISDWVGAVTAVEFENAVAAFIDQVRGQLRAEKTGETNVDRVWDDVLAERADPDASMRRRFEAMLGLDPDEADTGTLDGMVADSVELGEEAMREIAANTSQGGTLPRAVDLRQLAATSGFESRPRDAVTLGGEIDLPPVGGSPAWQRGVAAARALRQQEKLGDAMLPDAVLAAMVGVSVDALKRAKQGVDLAYEIGDEAGARVVLRSKWGTGRRFELARILADRLTAARQQSLRPATRSYTYRQKMQRAFAAELLCPVDAALAFMKGDASGESREAAARHFFVSERTVQTLLVNHGLLDRMEMSQDF